jgi:hypothetical protein
MSSDLAVVRLCGTCGGKYSHPEEKIKDCGYCRDEDFRCNLPNCNCKNILCNICKNVGPGQCECWKTAEPGVKKKRIETLFVDLTDDVSVEQAIKSGTPILVDLTYGKEDPDSGASDSEPEGSDAEPEDKKETLDEAMDRILASEKLKASRELIEALSPGYEKHIDGLPSSIRASIGMVVLGSSIRNQKKRKDL